MKPTALILDQENETAQNAPVSRLTGFSAAAIYGAAHSSPFQIWDPKDSMRIAFF